MSKNNNSVPNGTTAPSLQEQKFAKIGFELSSLIEEFYPFVKDDIEAKHLILQKYLALAKGLLQVDSYYNSDIILRIVNIINSEVYDTSL